MRKAVSIIVISILFTACADSGGPITVIISTEPQGANVEVYLNSTGGEPDLVDITPFELNLDGPSNFTMIISLDGYRSIKAYTMAYKDKSTIHFVLNRERVFTTIESTPEGARVEVDGEYICQTPCQRNLEYGNHQFRFSLVGFDDEVFEQEITPDNKEVNVDLYDYFDVLIDSDPQGASVRINGMHEDDYITPFNVALRQDFHEITFFLYGYHPKTESVYIDDQINEVMAVLDPHMVDVEIRSVPEGAEVTIDDIHEEYYVTNFDTSLQVGYHYIKFDLEGYLMTGNDFPIGEDTTDIEMVLQPLMIEVDIVSDPQGASVTIDGQYEDGYITPFPASLQQGLHDFVFELDGYLTLEQQVYVDLGMDQISVVLDQLIPVQIYSDPEKAWVSIDDQQDVCQTPCSLEMLSGLYNFTYTFNEQVILASEDISSQNKDLFVEFEVMSEVAVTVVTNPNGAEIKVDGQDIVEVTPTTINLKEGWHHFRFVLGEQIIETMYEVSETTNYVFESFSE